MNCLRALMGPVLLAACGAGCGLVSGLNDLAVGSLDGGGEAGDDGGLGEAGPCTPSGREVCDDGVDNDCNGKVDCADTACTPLFACVPAPDPGWSLVAFSASARPSCPSPYEGNTDVVAVDATGAGTCTCACQATGPGCATGSFTINDGAACGTHLATVAATGGCGSTAFTFTSAGTYQATPPAPPASCSATTTKTFGTPSNGRFCPTRARLGGGCSAGSVCAPRAGVMSVCVMQPGTVACPAAYKTGRTVGTSINDTRACAGCACGPSACGGAVHVFDGPNCNQRTAIIPADGQCIARSATNITVSSYSTDIAGTGCAVTAQATVTGAVTANEPRSVCCQ